MNPNQTAPTGSTLFVYEASNILVDDKNIHFVIMRFESARHKKLINSLSNYK